jgi:uncharacterized sulfatase
MRDAMTKPNILLITTDQHHASVLGINNPAVRTPNIDRLAAEGTVFTRAYCPNPTCTPTRASIITGLYPSQHGAWSLGTKMLEDVPTLGDDLQSVGYRTVLIGKAHFEQLKSTAEFPSKESNPFMQDAAFWKEFHGPYYGFERVELARNHTVEAHVGEHYALWMDEKGLKNWRDYFLKPTGHLSWLDLQKSGTTWHIPEKYHYNTWIAEKTNEELERCAKESTPFFIWASFPDPHRPRLVPEPWASMYDPATIDVPKPTPDEHDRNPPHFRLAMTGAKPKGWLERLAWLARLAGKQAKFLAYAKDFTDHGLTPRGLHGMHPHIYDPEGLKKEIAAYYGMVSLSDKYIGVILDRLDTLGLANDTIVIFTTDHGDFFGQHGLVTKGPYHYEDLLKIPFIIRYPGVVPAGRSCDAIQSLVDFVPTIEGLTGIQVSFPVSGVDQSAVWTGSEESARNEALVEMHHSPARVHLKTLVTRRYKITVYNNEEYGELFDLDADPGEFHNLWADPTASAVKTEMLVKLAQAELRKDYGLSRPTLLQ